MKKGFTLTELLVVIAIIGVLSVIAVPSVIHISKNIKERNYNSKVDMIVSAAELYATNKPEIFNGNLEVKIYVAELLNADYLKVEKTDEREKCKKVTVDKNGTSINIETKGCIVNPIDDKSMNEDYVLVRNETVGIVSDFNGESSTANNDQLVRVICEKFEKGANGGFIGKYSTDDSALCKCSYENNVDKTGNIIGLIAVSPEDKKGSSVEACIISGYEKNNYLYYDDMYFRVLGLYDLSGEEKGNHGIVPKIITDDGMEVQ